MKKELVCFTSQPLAWRQAVGQSPQRGFTLRNIMIYPWISKQYKNHESFLFDHLIVGANPLLNAILLSKIIKQKNHLDNKTEKIGVYLNDSHDYWCYHLGQVKSFWQTISKYLGKQVASYDDFFNYLFDGLNYDNIEIYLMKETDTKVHEIRYDAPVDGWIMFLSKFKDYEKTNSQEVMPTVTSLEDKIKDEISEKFFTYMKKPHFKNHNVMLEIKEPKASCEDYNIPAHILMAKHIYVTSLQQNCMNMKAYNEGIFTLFKYDFDKIKTFGSANKIACGFDFLEKQTMQDIKEIVSLPQPPQ